MGYFIKHLIETRVGRKLVNVQDVLIKNCKKCNGQVPAFFYGDTAVYKERCVYTSNNIVEEYRNTPTGFLPKKCRTDRCNKWKY
jgi:hypothetical protein